MPAMMPAESWLPASDGPTVSTWRLSSSNAIGSAPYFRLVARLVRLGLGEVAADLGAAVGDQPRSSSAQEITWPSRTIANCFSVLTSAWRDLGERLGAASPSKSRLTAQSTPALRDAGAALSRSVPSITAIGQQVLLTPSSSQVTSGLSGSSVDGGGLARRRGSWNSLNAATEPGVGVVHPGERRRRRRARRRVGSGGSAATPSARLDGSAVGAGLVGLGLGVVGASVWRAGGRRSGCCPDWRRAGSVGRSARARASAPGRAGSAPEPARSAAGAGRADGAARRPGGTAAGPGA